jgi:hypothetical protein
MSGFPLIFLLTLKNILYKIYTLKIGELYEKNTILFNF